MHMRGSRRVVVSLVVLVVSFCMLVIVASCGGGSSDASAGGAESGIPKSAPPLEIPEGLPPKKLVVRELFKGTGREAKKGDKVGLQYYCALWGSGVEYSNSWRYSSPPTFTLGEHIRLFRGLNLAVPGMKVGGGREVLVPSTLLYYPGAPHEHVNRLSSVICKVYLVKILGKA